MLSILQLLAMLSGNNNYTFDNYIRVCERNFNKLTLETKIELTIGCSKVNNHLVYSESRLLTIYGDDAIFLAK